MLRKFCFYLQMQSIITVLSVSFGQFITKQMKCNFIINCRRTILLVKSTVELPLKINNRAFQNIIIK